MNHHHALQKYVPKYQGWNYYQQRIPNKNKNVFPLAHKHKSPHMNNISPYKKATITTAPTNKKKFNKNL